MIKALLFLLTLILSLLFAVQAQASEIFGTISTNPSQNSPPVQSDPGDSSGEEENDSSSGSSSGNSGSSRQSDLGQANDKNESESADEEELNMEESEPIGEDLPPVPIAEILASTTPADLPKDSLPEEAPKKMILGLKIYPDGTLLRGPDKKIYLIKNGAKRYINTLKELDKYRGQEIISVSDEELSCYGGRGYSDGELIRRRGNVRVYVIKNGAKKHILNLEELRAYYFGLEIFNIFPEEMAAYEDWKE